eukprot:TRINITY_DN55175_c0_g1_i1.p1 TRINITY_DN55175_c0_g1~~TRINITY_DN55175_c0_g1_i1.p1  ORF type:complete len:709 (+),score=211.79 TRINITY_DN55175_c0_g1_i1:108-2234(+)
MPIFKRRSTVTKHSTEHSELQGEEPVVHRSAGKRDVDDPVGAYVSETPMRHIACTEDAVVTDSSGPSAGVSIATWRPGVGLVNHTKLRDAKKVAEKLSALTAWGGLVYVGCFDGTIIRVQMGDHSVQQLVEPAGTSAGADNCIDVLCIAGDPGEAAPELCCAGTAKGVVRMYSADSGAPAGEFAAHQTAITSLSWAPAPRVLVSTAQGDPVARVWSQDGVAWTCTKEISGFLWGECELRTTVWDHACGTLVAGDSGGNLYLWINAAEVLMSSASMPTPKVLTEELSEVRYMTAGRGDIVISDGSAVKVFDAATGNYLRSFTRSEGTTVSGQAAGMGYLFLLEPDTFPKCKLCYFDLPQRKVISRPPVSTSPTPAVGSGLSRGSGHSPPPSNLSFTSGGTSPTYGAPVALHKTASALSRPPGAASGRQRGMTGPGRGLQPGDAQGAWQAGSPPRLSPPPAPPAAVARTDSQLRAERAARTQGSLDFDDFATNRSLAAAPPAAERPNEAAAPPTADAGSGSCELADLFDAMNSGHSAPKSFASDPHAAPPESVKGGSMASSRRDGEGSPDTCPTRAESVSSIESARQQQHRAHTPPFAPQRTAPARPPPTGSITHSPPQGQAAQGLAERALKLEVAVQMLGGVPQLEQLMQLAAERGDHTQARAIKGIVDCIAQPMPRACGGAPPPVAPAPAVTDEKRLGASVDPFAGLF